MRAVIFQSGMRFAVLLGMFLSLAGNAVGQAGGYEATVSKWTSYEDVAKWLDGNFAFDHSRLNLILKRTQRNGPGGLLARPATETYDTKAGYCTDAANFAIEALNRINPEYKARYIFIKNQHGQPHHWVTGFMQDGKIMVMDYGAGPEWRSMKGVHGPYDSLDQYADFLRSLDIRKFAPELVEWRPVFPGQEG